MATTIYKYLIVKIGIKSFLSIAYEPAEYDESDEQLFMNPILQSSSLSVIVGFTVTSWDDRMIRLPLVIVEPPGNAGPVQTSLWHGRPGPDLPNVSTTTTSSGGLT